MAREVHERDGKTKQKSHDCCFLATFSRFAVLSDTFSGIEIDVPIGSPIYEVTWKIKLKRKIVNKNQRISVQSLNIYYKINKNIAFIFSTVLILQYIKNNININIFY